MHGESSTSPPSPLRTDRTLAEFAAPPPLRKRVATITLKCALLRPHRWIAASIACWGRNGPHPYADAAWTRSLDHAENGLRATKAFKRRGLQKAGHGCGWQHVQPTGCRCCYPQPWRPGCTLGALVVPPRWDGANAAKPAIDCIYILWKSEASGEVSPQWCTRGGISCGVVKALLQQLGLLLNYPSTALLQRGEIHSI